MAGDPNQPIISLDSAGAMPLVGLGTGALTGSQCHRAVRYALEVGYRHLDTATMYHNEHEVGQAVRDSSLPREEVFVTTKLPPEAAGQERRTLHDSLRALQMDYVDLWLIHWPPPGRALVQTWEQLLAEHRQRGVVLEGYSPFTNTDLGDPVLVGVAADYGVNPAQVVVRWHLDHGVVVIPRSASRERIAANFDVFGFSLSDEELGRINGLSTGRPAARGARPTSPSSAARSATRSWVAKTGGRQAGADSRET